MPLGAQRSRGDQCEEHEEEGGILEITGHAIVRSRSKEMIMCPIIRLSKPLQNAWKTETGGAFETTPPRTFYCDHIGDDGKLSSDFYAMRFRGRPIDPH